MAGGEIVAQSLVDWNDCVGACILLINIAIKYINKGEEWVGGGMATESFADRQVCARRILITSNCSDSACVFRCYRYERERLLWRR